MSHVVPDTLVRMFVRAWNRDNDGWCRVSRDRINFGWCYQFAILLKRLHGDKATILSDQGHVWVRIGDKHYDTDHPRGTKNIFEMVTGRGEPREMTEEEVVHFWKHGGSGEVQDELISSILNAYLKNNRPSVWERLKRKIA
jgi:hypothetical protein